VGGCRYSDVVSGAGGVGGRPFLQHVLLLTSFYGLLSSFVFGITGSLQSMEANVAVMHSFFFGYPRFAAALPG
jgi:hypothetical protein